MAYYKNVRPGRKWFKTVLAKVVFVILGRAFEVLSGKDLDIKREVASWPEGFKLVLDIMPHGPKLVLSKVKGGIRAKALNDKEPDLCVQFKNIESAFLILTPQMGVPTGFAQHRFIVVGDIAKSMSFVRCLNLILCYLYPNFLCRNLMRNIPKINPFQRITRRLYFYSIGLFTGF